MVLGFTSRAPPPPHTQPRRPNAFPADTAALLRRSAVLRTCSSRPQFAISNFRFPVPDFQSPSHPASSGRRAPAAGGIDLASPRLDIHPSCRATDVGSSDVSVPCTTAPQHQSTIPSPSPAPPPSSTSPHRSILPLKPPPAAARRCRRISCVDRRVVSRSWRSARLDPSLRFGLVGSIVLAAAGRTSRLTDTPNRHTPPRTPRSPHRPPPRRD